jgi:U3 small nucleolar RNA-associated protein 25
VLHLKLTITQFVFSNLNQMPKESHGADFSRIKPWYLDGHAAYLRQTILLSPYETPEMRNLYSSSLKNVAGKMRTEKRWAPVGVPDGIEQNFVHFDCASPMDEVDKRFHHFTTQVCISHSILTPAMSNGVVQMLPAILKSAVQSANTAVFVPSSFDFIRVHNYFRKNAGVSFAVLSEYASRCLYRSMSGASSSL